MECDEIGQNPKDSSTMKNLLIMDQGEPSAHFLCLLLASLTSPPTTIPPTRLPSLPQTPKPVPTSGPLHVLTPAWSAVSSHGGLLFWVSAQMPPPPIGPS